MNRLGHPIDPGGVLALHQVLGRRDQGLQGHAAHFEPLLQPLEIGLHRRIARSEIFLPLRQSVGPDRGADRRQRARPRGEPGAVDRRDGRDRGNERAGDEAPQLQPLISALVLLLPVAIEFDLPIDAFCKIPLIGHRPRRAAVITRGPDRVVLGGQRIARRPRGDRLAALDEGVRRIGLGGLVRRIIANPGGEAKALRLDRFRGRPRAQPARFRADRQGLAPHIQRQCRRDRRRAGERAHDLGARRPACPIGLDKRRRRAQERGQNQRSHRPEIPAVRLRLQRSRPLGPAAIFVPRLLDHKDRPLKPSPGRRAILSHSRRRASGSLHAAFSAWSRSARMSSMCSMPIERRT